MTTRSILGIAALALSGAIGCAGEGSGSVQIFVEPEDSIPEGLQGGEGEENIHDGWSVGYDRFLITIGDVRAARSDDDETLADPSVYVLDLRAAPAGGYVIASFDDVAAARWDRFGFALPNASASAKTLAPTTADDAQLLVENGWSIYVEGRITKSDGQSCPPGGSCVAAPEVRFRWGFPAGTSFADCATEDGLAGFAVPSGSTAQVKPTIHGDHWFFTNFTSGAELTERRAQYVADADLDGDGETTIDELKATDAADVFPAAIYNLSGSLGGTMQSAYDFVLAQTRTLGDFQGDGECPTRKILP